MGLKTLAKQLQRDFVPDGEPIDPSTLTFRVTTEDEVFQCCARTTYDSQSGWIFCGCVADIIADVPGRGYLAIYRNHAKDLPDNVRPKPARLSVAV